MRKPFVASWVLAAGLAVGGTATAQGTWYTSEASWIAAITGLKTDVFTDLSGFHPSPLTRLSGAYAVGSTGGLFVGNTVGGATLSSNNALPMTFSFAVNGFGGWFNVTDTAFNNQVATLGFTTSDSNAYALNVNATGDTFLGYVSDTSLTSVTVSPASGASTLYAGTTKFMLGNRKTGGTTGGGGAVPEPGEWAAMGVLAAGLAGLVLRKRKQA